MNQPPLNKGRILHEQSVKGLNKQQKSLKFLKGESLGEACYVSFIAAKGKCSELEESCGVLYLSKGMLTDVRPIWKEVKKQQRSVYECIPADTKKKFFYERNSKEIRNFYDESCGIVSCSPAPLNFIEVERSERFWIFIVDDVLLQGEAHKITLSLTNSHFQCSVEFEKSAVHGTWDNSSSVKFSEFLFSPPSDTGDIPPKITNIMLTEKPRAFNKSVEDTSYTKGYQLAALETGRKDLIQPAHEFKLFSLAHKKQESAVGYFVKETLRFACGCLNSRTNGTIHFGIADGYGPESKKHKKSRREIGGVKVQEQDPYVAALTRHIETKFGALGGIAKNCIRPPTFVPVKNGEDELYVIEVDVEPIHMYTEGKQFKVDLDDSPPATAYERDGPNTVVCGNQHVNMMKKLDEERNAREMSSRNAQIKTPVYRPLLSSTFRKLLCLKENVNRIIVLTKPLSTSEQNCADFLRIVKYHSVIDFDNECRILNKVYNNRKSKPSPHLAEDLIYKNSISNNQAWILANGRLDEGKAEFNDEDWYESDRNRCLSTYVKNISTNFPSSRTLVLFLLLSEPYKPALYLFQEFRKQYGGLNQLVYVAENDSIADSWKRGLNISMKRLRPSGLVGLSWSEFSEQIKQLTGQSMGSTFLMPNASGVGMPSDRKDFFPNILHPLSLNECEYLGDLTYEEQKNKSAEEERKFSSGENVSWENFWFTDNGFNHVLPRDVLQEGLEKTEDLLRKECEPNTFVLFLEIKYEVGAGGTTLGKNILWHFASSSKCRCCVVKHITDQTAVSLLELWRHNDLKGSGRLPVLALLDGFSQESIERLESDVTTAAREYSVTNRPVIVFIKTNMYSTLPQKGDYVERQTVLLTQRLSRKEQRWFVHKLESFMQIQLHPNAPAIPKHLMTFMMMKPNLCHKYTKAAKKWYKFTLGYNDMED